MNIYCKIALSSLLFASPLALTSCDGEASQAALEGDITLTPDAISSALDELVSGDSMTYTTIQLLENEQFITDGDEISADSAFQMSVGGLTLNYTKTARSQFTLEGLLTPTADLNTALQNLLGAPAELDTPFRELLRQPGSYDATDIAEIAETLTNAGADVIVDPNNPLALIARSEVKYIHRIESTNANLIEGDMAGIFTSEHTFHYITFTTPTAAQISALRLFTPSYRIPSIDVSSHVIRPGLQAGTFDYTLTNPAVNVPLVN